MTIKSPKQLAWLRYIEDRWTKRDWAKLSESTQLALKAAWWAGWSARQAVKRSPRPPRIGQS